MRKTFGPQRLTVIDLEPGRDIKVFRIVRTDTTDDPVFLNSFRSHYEMSAEPRGVERSSTAVHMGISTFLSREAAQATAAKWEKLGDYVAEVVLKHGRGFNFAHTGQPLHLTVWGDPIKLSAAVAEVTPVDR